MEWGAGTSIKQGGSAEKFRTTLWCVSERSALPRWPCLLHSDPGERTESLSEPQSLYLENGGIACHSSDYGKHELRWLMCTIRLLWCVAGDPLVVGILAVITNESLQMKLKREGVSLEMVSWVFLEAMPVTDAHWNVYYKYRLGVL